MFLRSVFGLGRSVITRTGDIAKQPVRQNELTTAARFEPAIRSRPPSLS